jgi:ATP-binding cassette subfamily F protein uup
LEGLPDRIESLETQLAEVHQTMADPAFYRQDSAEIVKTNARLRSLDDDLAEAYCRWEALESQQGK